MAIDIKFDLIGNPEPPTIILANRNGNKLGQLKVDKDSIDISDKFIEASEFSFTLNKYYDNKLAPLWDKVLNFKLVYCKEWDMWFEIKVELDEDTKTVKTVFCKQLGQAELSQIKLYDVEINTEKDIERDDYKISILYDEDDPKASILDRMLEKAPHYRIAHVDPTIKKIQRSFSFNDSSIDDSFQEVAEEIGCLFVYPSNSDEYGKIQRTVYVYDLQQNCNDCGHRGEFTNKCPKCGSANITNGYGEDTLIFVTSDELATSGIQLVTDVDSVKNCFKLEAGDDLMTATIRNCNPNGTDYIWHLSDSTKEDMSNELVEKLESYDELYNYYQNDYVADSATLLSENESKIFIVGTDVQVGDIIRFKYLSSDIDKASIYYTIPSRDSIIVDLPLIEESEYSSFDVSVSGKQETIVVNKYVSVYLLKNIVNDYNNLVEKYQAYNEDLLKISFPIKGYSALMNADYNAIDLALYLKSSLMPSVKMSETNAEEQSKLLTSSSLSPVAVANINTASLATMNSAVLAMAKVIVKSTYKVQVNASELIEENDKKYWQGNFTITNYSDDEDTCISNIISVEVNDDLETFVKQKIEKALNKENADNLSISGLFKKEYDDFCNELQKYALIPLLSFRDACQACIDILIEQGVGSDSTWSDDENAESNLYASLYTPYYDKLKAIEAEIKIRENEINIISGVYDLDGNLIVKGLQTEIEEHRAKIQNALNFENYLGNELWLEFCAYRREDKYANENYISDGLNNAELFKRALEFFEIAENEIYKSAELQHSISTTLNNLLAIPKFKDFIKSFKVGNWIRVQVDDKIYKLRLLEYGIDFGDFNNIKVEFSDVTKIKNGITDIKSILSKASSMATSYDSVKRQANQGAKSNSVLSNWVETGLNATQTKIVDSYDENLMFGKNAFWCRQYDPITDTYSDEQIKIVNSTIAITDDNWATTKTAIGKYYYVDPVSGKQKEAYGINGETVVGKFILGENLSIHAGSGNNSGSMIFDGNGLTIKSASEDGVGTMTFNEDGLIVNHGNNTVTISPKSKEVMNITNGEDDVFEINEDGELSISGNIMARSLKLESGVKIDSGVITNLADVATTASYNDLIDTPTKLSDFINDGVFITKDASDLTNYYKKTEVDNSLKLKANSDDLSTVAISGSYNDLTDIDELKKWVLEQIQSALNS